MPKWNVARLNLGHHIRFPIKCPTTGTGDGHPSGSVELNPFWLGEAKTGHFDEGTSRGTSPATAGAFDDAGGAAAASPAVAASLRRLPRLGAAHRSSPEAIRQRCLSARHQITIPNFAFEGRHRRRRKLAGRYRPRQTNSSHTRSMRRVSPLKEMPVGER